MDKKKDSKESPNQESSSPTTKTVKEEPKQTKEDLSKATSKADVKKKESSKSKDHDKKKKEKDKKEQEHRRNAEENLDEETEIAELEATTKPGDPTELYQKNLYSIYSSTFYDAYGKIRSFARDLNIQLSHPEIVLLGPASHGKSSLLEAIIGKQFNHIGQGLSTKRPLFLNLVNNPECEEPKITLKRDIIVKSPGSDQDIQIPLHLLPSELGKRMTQISKDPIFIQYEYKYITNMTFIDTPGIPEENSPDYDQIIEIVTNLARPPNRTLFCVEEASDWSKLRMLKISKTIDPDLSRTIFIYTKFNTQLQLLNSVSMVNRYLSGIIPDTKSFFVSLPSLAVRRKQTTDLAYQEKVWQAYRRDMINLEQIQYDKRFERNIGIHAFRKHLLNKIWKSYQEGIPEVLKCIRNKKSKTEILIKDTSKQLETFNESYLRTLYKNYCVKFLQTLNQLIEGTSEGMPMINGQTLEEEKYAVGDFEWVDSYNHTIHFDAEKWNVQYWDCKIYGGQQFERLLSEFKAVCDRAEIAQLSLDDVATSAGINRVNNVPNYAWAAADLAQNQIQETFIPLIQQLKTRAIYVLKRLYDITNKMIESKKNNKKTLDINNNDKDDIFQYQYFMNFMKNTLYQFIENKGELCKEKCLDEFYSTKTLYWELIEFSNQKFQMNFSEKNPEEAMKSVVKLATELFNTIRDRLTKNIMLKFYNYMLVPMQTELWVELQKKMNEIDEDQLNLYFQIDSTKKMIENKVKSYKDMLTNLGDLEKQFIESAKVLAHPETNLSMPNTK